mmetsp:Transcript_59964/g.165963  ORF Transcript_59964/g.165963 Transcript_59964/m.165963 type:complete len:354 (+) Transcript_59964:685-1746(+)
MGHQGRLHRVLREGRPARERGRAGRAAQPLRLPELRRRQPTQEAALLALGAGAHGVAAPEVPEHGGEDGRWPLGEVRLRKRGRCPVPSDGGGADDPAVALRPGPHPLRPGSAQAGRGLLAGVDEPGELPHDERRGPAPHRGDALRADPLEGHPHEEQQQALAGAGEVRQAVREPGPAHQHVRGSESSYSRRSCVEPAQHKEVQRRELGGVHDAVRHEGPGPHQAAAQGPLRPHAGRRRALRLPRPRAALHVLPGHLHAVQDPLGDADTQQGLLHHARALRDGRRLREEVQVARATDRGEAGQQEGRGQGPVRGGQRKGLAGAGRRRQASGEGGAAGKAEAEAARHRRVHLLPA